MRDLLSVVTKTLAAITILLGAPSNGDEPITPVIEFQSGPLTPALVLNGVPQPIHQIRLIVDAKLARGTLILDGNTPEFDEFGALTGGLQTPHVRGKGDPNSISKVRCTIELLKEGLDKWRVYDIRTSKIGTMLHLATRGTLANGSSARILVLASNDKVSAVIRCTPYGLVVP
ncbi:MAG: hypothetical protein P1U77_12175 [Rubripirellula sp.]|nr:hypothetical protein [Rubripirellula sp.]